MFYGTTVEATVVRAVDGDTLRVKLAGDREEVLRILALDTEESNAGSSKPVTPWGKQAKARAIAFFPVDHPVTLEFGGTEPLAVCFEKYRDNYGRLLVFVHKDGQDYQETMIAEGFSPYFVKYGYASIPAYHQRYTEAERQAQASFRGLWDQVTVNGSEINNYALLTTWWHLRARVIADYRAIENPPPQLLNTRLDYARLMELAATGAEVVVFTELRSFRRTRGNHLLIDIGSRHQPFQVFIPQIDSDTGQAIFQLLQNRYLPGDLHHPRRGYAYVQGALQRYQNREDLPPIVQLTVTSTAQVRDDLPPQ